MVRILLYGNAEKFQNYDRALRCAGAELGWTADGAVKEDYDALFLAGGVDIAPWRMGAAEGLAGPIDEARDGEEFELLSWFLEQKKPVMAVCRGVQVLNVALGGDLHQHIEGHNRIEGADRVHGSTTLPGSRMERLYGPAPVINSAHHQALDRLGDGLYATQWAPDGIVEAVEHHELPVWGVQWHPERFTETDGQKVYDLFVQEVEKFISGK